ncbi:hypothetical protein BCR36DRAFT_442705 [Piromyces finnis]|uniref:Uncharacterized protein n=1 Tax=Piromyces finnis TaxID=1754191 RepID=A0A1Y1UJ82_9FUNG|nr:hypothetical protein BCR36DRAFT_442705 [Piromyces finnis]|eukprot:ORX38123.1 hypothetical protein BCR36DRAFT_442705 [Piromyces finnis]
MEYQSHSYYSKSDILLETQWNNISIKKNTDLHLSLISQGMFNEKLINKYDTNYYYPESSGEALTFSY